MKKMIFALVVLATLVGLPTSASAQTGTGPGPVIIDYQGDSRPIPIVPVKPTGIRGLVSVNTLTVVGVPTLVPEISVVVSLVKFDSETGAWFADRSTAKKFGACVAKETANCVARNGSYQISDSALPPAEDELNLAGRLLDVRAEAPGFSHFVWNKTQVWAVSYAQTKVDDITIIRETMDVKKPTMRWVNDEVIAVGVWVRSDYNGSALFGYLFSGSSWSKSKVDYGMALLSEVPYVEGWNFIEQEFTAPVLDIANYGGVVCGKVQVSAVDMLEYVYAQTGEVCTPLRQLIVVTPTAKK